MLVQALVVAAGCGDLGNRIAPLPLSNDTSPSPLGSPLRSGNDALANVSLNQVLRDMLCLCSISARKTVSGVILLAHGYECFHNDLGHHVRP